MMINSIKKDQMSFGAMNEAVQRTVSDGWRWCARVLNKHTDLISSGSILAITTCLLAAKIFKKIPPLLPRLALVVYHFGGIIWLNVQVRDFLKSCRDLHRVLTDKEWHALTEMAAKVALKAVNILMTCFTFSASVAASVGFPQISLGIYLAMRPVGLASLAVAIAIDIRDYFLNEKLIMQLDQIDNQGIDKIANVMVSFFETIKSSKQSAQPLFKADSTEWHFASHLVRQLDTFTLETFQEGLPLKHTVKDVRIEALKLFYSLKDSVINKQASTKANLSLIALGYFSIGLCRAFPDTLIEWTTRWGMSVLYTDELIRQKLFQADLAKNI